MTHYTSSPDQQKHLDIIIENLSKTIPPYAPGWMTVDYKMLQRREIHHRWKPVVGDWYFCREGNAITRITSLGDYAQHSTAAQINTERKACDRWIPNHKVFQQFLEDKYGGRL